MSGNPSAAQSSWVIASNGSLVTAVISIVANWLCFWPFFSPIHFSTAWSLVPGVSFSHLRRLVTVFNRAKICRTVSMNDIARIGYSLQWRKLSQTRVFFEIFEIVIADIPTVAISAITRPLLSWE